MNKNQFAKAIELAKSPAELTHYLSIQFDLDIDWFISMENLASIIRGECQFINGDWDANNMREVYNNIKHLKIV